MDTYDDWQNHIPIPGHLQPGAIHLRLPSLPANGSPRTNNFGSTEHPFDDLQPPPRIRLRPRTPSFDVTDRMATRRRVMKRPPPSSPLVRYSYTYEDVILDQFAGEDEEFDSEATWDTSEELHSYPTFYRSKALFDPFPAQNLRSSRTHHPLRRFDSFLETKKVDFIEEEQEEEDDDVPGCSFFGRCTKLGSTLHASLSILRHSFTFKYSSDMWRSTPSSTPNMLLQLGCYTAKNLPVSIP
ncbi:hypothetical protein CVT26_010580 [Gymnopilus dilepis]|uniref:Uncharacterized protein n=1 Tax=Gymnopilus dilepis TaxID=231916 RepID=A0A409VZI8_9AGAR|nr:hypothetical protein CVT26_010580 [Gymnopilus dilepis]